MDRHFDIAVYFTETTGSSQLTYRVLMRAHLYDSSVGGVPSIVWTKNPPEREVPRFRRFSNPMLLKNSLTRNTVVWREGNWAEREVYLVNEADAQRMLVWLDAMESQGLAGIKDVKPGRKTRLPTSSPQVTVYDYSRLVPAPFKLYVEVMPGDDKKSTHLRAFVMDPSAGPDPQGMLRDNEVGNVGMRARNDNFDWRSGAKLNGATLFVDNAWIRPTHQRRGLGALMYEAAFAHAYHRHGARYVAGSVHSTPASRTHEKVSAKHGLEYRAVTLRDEPPDKTKDLSHDERYIGYRYDLRGVNAALSGIKDIPKGRTRAGERDLSAVLTPEQRKMYRIVVDEKPYNMDGSTFTAHLTLRSDPNKDVGFIRGYTKANGAQRVLTVEEAEVYPPHRGKGLGTKLYEALYSEVHERDGVTHVKGGTHSTMASRVHDSLAAKHGWQYDAVPNNEDNGGDWPNEQWDEPLTAEGRRDDRYQRYGYQLTGVRARRRR